MSTSLHWIHDEQSALATRNLVRRRREVVALPRGRCRIGGRELLNFASNDYLDLAHDPRVVVAAREALDAAGAGATASALVCGRSPWHSALEERLARFENQPAAILFPSGYAANVGTICALAGSEDALFSDRLNHASLIDGSRLSGARVHVYRHDDLGGLAADLKKAASARRRLILTDSVFSMDGDLAPLPDLCDLAERHGAILLVDEAHATGVFGSQGRGVAELQKVESRVSARVGTLSKAVGALGGFVAGPQALVDWLWNRARPQMFSTALPPSVCAAAVAAIEIIASEPGRREHLRLLCERFRGLLRGAGIERAASSVGPIVPVILSTPERAVEVATRLEESGFLVPAIRPPTVPEGTSRLRITLSSGHGFDDIEQLAAALRTALA